MELPESQVSHNTNHCEKPGSPHRMGQGLGRFVAQYRKSSIKATSILAQIAGMDVTYLQRPRVVPFKELVGENGGVVGRSW